MKARRADSARRALAARQELWALACALGPRPAGQLRLVARRLLDRRPAGVAAPDPLRRWWHFTDGAELPAEVGGLPGVTLLGAEG